MGTIAEKMQKLLETKNAIKAAIIRKGQTVSESDTFASYADKISAIQTGTDTSDATMTASDLRKGKIGYGQDGKVVGTVADVAVEKPSISVSDSGLITATHSQSFGFVDTATASTTLQMNTYSAKTITPGTQQQTLVTSGKFMTGNIAVLGDGNLVAENIKDGVTIFGVTGTAKGSETVIGTYKGNARASSATVQEVDLGFRPKFVFISDDSFVFASDTPWYYYADSDGTNTNQEVSACAAYAFADVPLQATDADNNLVTCLEITDTGFCVRNLEATWENSAGTRTRNTSIFINRTNHTYHYVAIP